MPTTIHHEIDALADALDNHDSVARDGAIRASEAGRPAFWTKPRYQHDGAWLFLAELNGCGDFADAADAYRGYFPETTFNPLTLQSLDWLIPLNDAAVYALRDAYSGLGTFRHLHELRGREARILRRAEAA